MNQSGPLLDLPKSYRFIALVLILLYCSFIVVLSRHNEILTTISGIIWILTVAYPILAYRKELGVENPMVIVSTLSMITMPIRQTGTLINGIQTHVALPTYSRLQLEDLYFYGNLLQSLAIWMTYLGFRFGRNFRGFKIYDLKQPNKNIQLLIAAFISISLIGFLITILISGDLSSHLLNIARGSASRKNAIDVNAGGPLSVLIGLICAAGILTITSKQHPLIIVTTCIAALGILFITDGRRSSVIYPLLLFGIAYSVTNRKIPALRSVLIGLFGIAILGFASSFREANWGQKKSLSLDFFRQVSVEKAITTAVEEFTARSGTSSPLYPIMARVPNQVEHLYGSGYLKWFNLFVPRLIWKDKPRGIDVDTAVTFFNASWGIPPGDVGQAYWEFNVPGVVFVFFFLGIAYRYFFNSLRNSEVSYCSLAVYLMGIFYLGADQNSFRMMVVFFAPMVGILVMFKYLRVRFA